MPSAPHRTRSNYVAVYAFLSCLLGKTIISSISGCVIVVIGIAYMALEFVPSIEPPANMREAAAAVWDAEQILSSRHIA